MRPRPCRFADLGPYDRRRAILRCGLTIVVAWVIIVGAYYVLPIGRESELRPGVRIAVDVALIASVFTWQIRRISRAELPELRAHRGARHRRRALSGAVLWRLSGDVAQHRVPSPSSLDQTRALYFTISVFSTVGFGDITPRTDTARLIVSAADAARPGGHRCGRSPHLQCGQEPDVASTAASAD